MIRRFPIRLLGLVLCAGSASAQTTLWEFQGDARLDWYGYSVRGAGDVDGDGRADLIVGAPLHDRGGAEAGSAWVLSGADGSLLHSFHGSAPGVHLGYAVSGAGDVDGDGHDDLIVGAPRVNYYEGAAWIFSGRDGSVLHAFTSPGTSAFFGGTVCSAGDIDADGRPDVVIGAPYADMALVYSGRDGSLLLSLSTGGGEDFGLSVAGAGDVDADGQADVIVGAPRRFYYNKTGSAYVYSGRDGSLLHAFDGAGGPWIWFGYCVAGAGDVDADGFDDVIVGAPSDELVADRGSALVFSGRDGSLLHLFEASTTSDGFFGSSVSAAGDLDRDGHGDVVVNIRVDSWGGKSPGLARVFSGRDGSALATFSGAAPGDGFARSTGPAGDVNGDGRPDLILGAPWSGPTRAGSARVVACCDFVGQVYCAPAVANSTGTPGTLTAKGSPAVAADDFVLTASSLPPTTVGLFLASRTKGLVQGPAGSQGVLCLGAPLGRFASQVQSAAGTGQLSIAVDLAYVPGLGPVLPGSTWTFQCAYRDTNPAATWNLTDAVEVTFE